MGHTLGIRCEQIVAYDLDAAVLCEGGGGFVIILVEGVFQDDEGEFPDHVHIEIIQLILGLGLAVEQAVILAVLLVVVGIGGNVHLETDLPFITGLNDGLGHGFPDLLVGLEDAFGNDDEIPDVGCAAEELLHLLRPAGVDIPAGIGGFRKGIKAETHTGHGGLAAGGGDTAAVAVVTGHHGHAGNRQIHGARAADVAIEGDAQCRGAGLQGRGGHSGSGIAAQMELRVGHDGQHGVVHRGLIGRVHTHKHRSDHVIYVVDRAHDALSAEFLAAVKGKIHFMSADRDAGGTHGTANRAVFCRYDSLNTGIAAVGIHLPGLDRNDRCSRHFVLSLHCIVHFTESK